MKRIMKQSFIVCLSIVFSLAIMMWFTPDTHAITGVVRLSQNDQGQYNGINEYNMWNSATCSTAAMAEAMNWYGNHYRITDILQFEGNSGYINASQGLIMPDGIEATLQHFGFNVEYVGHQLSLDDVINQAEGAPVIVQLPNFNGIAHILIVVGGDANNVQVVDSSANNYTSVPRSQFLSWWGGNYGWSATVI